MTKLSFTLAALVNEGPCYDGLQRLSKSLTGPYDGTTVVNYYDNVEHCETSDLLWALRLTRLTDDEIRVTSVKTAIYAARRVLHLFENESPNDLRPRRAIEAAEFCVKSNFSDESLATARAAVAAAYAATARAAVAATNLVWAAVAVAARAAATATNPVWAAVAVWAADAADTVTRATKADPIVKSEIKNYALELIRSYDNEYCALDKLYTLHESSK